MKYRYQLEPYKGTSTRFQCPNCEQQKTYTRYVDTKTNQRLPFKYGRCERLNKCGYHLNPYTAGYQLADDNNDFYKKNILHQAVKKPHYIPDDLFEQSLQCYDQNNFVQFLMELFGTEKAMELVQIYHIGSSNYWQGSTVFWIIDNSSEQNKIVGGQLVLFDTNGNTAKKELPDGTTFRYTRWVHTALNHVYKKRNTSIPKWLTNYCKYGNKFPVPFGLTSIDESKPIAIVEAPKTAIIAKGYLPQYNWLAIGSASYLNNANRLLPLAGKNITLFPDAGCYDNWHSRGQQFSYFANFNTSDLLERKNTTPGSDLADYLVQIDYTQFLKLKIKTNE